MSQQRLGSIAWVGWIAAGTVWVVVVVWFITFALARVDVEVAKGTIGDPGAPRVAVAYVSAGVFALPGVAFVVLGVRRRRR